MNSIEYQIAHLQDSATIVFRSLKQLSEGTVAYDAQKQRLMELDDEIKHTIQAGGGALVEPIKTRLAVIRGQYYTYKDAMETKAIIDALEAQGSRKYELSVKRGELSYKTVKQFLDQSLAFLCDNFDTTFVYSNWKLNNMFKAIKKEIYVRARSKIALQIANLEPTGWEEKFRVFINSGEESTIINLADLASYEQLKRATDKLGLALTPLTGTAVKITCPSFV
jgi:hypothetical protein